MKFHLPAHRLTPAHRRSPCGERGLKSMRGLPRLYVVGRSLCGERGLKYLCHLTGLLCLLSFPIWGAWIEMCTSLAKTKSVRSLPMRGVWIKIRGSCQATITGNVSGWQMVHLWCYSLSYCDWRKVCGSIFKKTR